jgi:uncharacterized protein (UPF0332 family)
MNTVAIQAELARARKSLQAAGNLHKDCLYEDAISRAYYAVMHAAKAALLVHDQIPESHAAIRRAFGIYLVRSGDIEKEWAAVLSREYDHRIAADYDANIIIEPANSESSLNEAVQFLDRIEQYLISSGVNLDKDSHHA